MPIKIRNYFLMAFCGQYPENHFKNPFLLTSARHELDDHDGLRVYEQGIVSAMTNKCQMANSRINIYSNSVAMTCQSGAQVSAKLLTWPNCKQLQHKSCTPTTRVGTRKRNKNPLFTLWGYAGMVVLGRGLDLRATCSMKFK